MNRTSISDIKMKAKDNLLGCYGLAAGSFALLFALIYGLMMILLGAFNAGVNPENVVSGNYSLLERIETDAISWVVSLFMAILTTGYYYQMMEISYNRKPKLRDLFYCFKNHPDKVIIIEAFFTAVAYVSMIPSRMVKVSLNNVLISGEGGEKFLLWIVLSLAGVLVSGVIGVIFSFSFFVYIDDPDMSVKDIMKCAQKLIKGNFFRYIYLCLTFVGYTLLGFVSLGITMMYTYPYQSMAIVELYKDSLRVAGRDIAGEDDGRKETDDGSESEDGRPGSTIDVEI